MNILDVNIYTQYMYSYPHKTAYRVLEKETVVESFKNIASTETMLYLHIPFCESKCGFCNLFSIIAPDQYRKDYLSAVTRQIEQYTSVKNLHTINWSSFVIGGGTPTVLSISQLENLFLTIKNATGVTADNRFSVIEVSPDSADSDKLTFLKENNFNRVSIGVQSFIDSETTALARDNKSDVSKQAIQTMKDLNFEVLNIDLIYGIKGQTIKSLQYSLDTALSYSPEEIYIYPLYIQPETFLHSKYIPDICMRYEMYVFVSEYLQTKGYYQTSMRRFCKNKPEVPVSCGFENTLSFGCGGRSYLGNLHFCTEYATNRAVCKTILDKFIETEDFFANMTGYNLNTDELKRRYIIKNLPYYSGISIVDYQKLFSSSILEDFPEIHLLAKQGLIVIDKDVIKLTSKGLGYSDYIAPMFISDEVAKKSRVDLL